MATDLTVVLEDRPGTLAALGEALGSADVNVEGVCGVRIEGQGIVHVLVEDAAAARSAIEQAGLQVREEREVVVVDVEDRPGALGQAARRIAAAGGNLDLVYLATNTRLVVGADDLDSVRGAL
jgi:hypothetical protein